jgi:hypothetical protein
MIAAAGLSTPTALRLPAQGCEARATLGDRVVVFSQPQRGCGTGVRRREGRNPVGVVFDWRTLPKVAPRTAQPWAGGRNPVGILWRGRARNGGPK